MRIGIIVAMDKELAGMKAVLTDMSEETDGKFTFCTGILNGRQIIVMKCGIGKVNAAVGAVEMIHRFHPDYIISSGVAGGIDLGVSVMDVVVADQLVYHDAYVGEDNEGIDIVSPYPVSGFLLKKAKELAEVQEKSGGRKIWIGTICTGEQFVTKRSALEGIKQNYPSGLAVDMESCAIAHACRIMDVPFISFRIISDTIGEKANEEQYENFWATLADRSFNILQTYIESL